MLLQKRYPGLNITEEDIKDAEKELESIIKEHNENKTEPKLLQENKESENDKQNSADIPPLTEDKKTI